MLLKDEGVPDLNTALPLGAQPVWLYKPALLHNTFALLVMKTSLQIKTVHTIIFNPKRAKIFLYFTLKIL